MKYQIKFYVIDFRQRVIWNMVGMSYYKNRRKIIIISYDISQEKKIHNILRFIL